jgi:glycine cleavage system H protein
LEDEPEIVNSDPYGDGWMIAISINNEDELDELLSAGEYKEMVKDEG